MIKKYSQKNLNQEIKAPILIKEEKNIIYKVSIRIDRINT